MHLLRKAYVTQVDNQTGSLKVKGCLFTLGNHKQIRSTPMHINELELLRLGVENFIVKDLNSSNRMSSTRLVNLGLASSQYS